MKYKLKRTIIIIITIVLQIACSLMLGKTIYRVTILPFMRYESAEAAFEGSKPFGAKLVDIIENGNYALIRYKKLFDSDATTNYKFTYKTENGYVMMKNSLPIKSKLTVDGIISIFNIDGNMFIRIMNGNEPHVTTATDSLSNDFVFRTYGSGQGFDSYVTIGFAAQKRDELPTNYSITINGTEYKVFE